MLNSAKLVPAVHRNSLFPKNEEGAGPPSPSLGSATDQLACVQTSPFPLLHAERDG